MTDFAAQIDAWVRKSEKRMDVVVKQATNDLIKGIDITAGINRGGSRVKGTIPRDLGALAGSLQSTLYGSTSVGGENSYSFVVASMKAGDVAEFSWGGAAAPYAKEVHYGSNNLPGTFWVTEAAIKWQGYVTAATTRAKAQVNG